MTRSDAAETLPAAHDANAPGRGRDLGRLALAAVAGALIAQGTGVLTFASPAQAQRAGSSGILNPADQRNEMIVELRKLNDRLGKLEKAVTASTFDVNVVSMPAQSTASGD